MIRLWLLGLLASYGCGCGGGWADSDTKSATDAVRAQMMIESICGGEGGACNPAQVRALERVSYCSSESMLFRHGQSLPDGGITCPPP